MVAIETITVAEILNIFKKHLLPYLPTDLFLIWYVHSYNYNILNCLELKMQIYFKNSHDADKNEFLIKKKYTLKSSQKYENISLYHFSHNLNKHFTPCLSK